MHERLTVKDCYRLFAEHGTPPHIIRHCETVSRVACNIAASLRAAGREIDPELARVAGLLHDIARLEKDHAARAAEIAGRYDARLADIVRVHMNHDIARTVDAFTEADALSLADRSVLEDAFVGYEPRIKAIIARFSDNPEAVSHLQAKLLETAEIAGRIEAFVGKTMDRIAQGGEVDVRRLLGRVTKPGRYIGGETGSIRKEGLQASVRVCFCFPDLYEIGMSHTGLQILYGLMNALDGVACERAFAPAADMESLLREEHVPLFMLESQRPVAEADIVAFTLPYELCFTNVLNMLDLSGLPITSAERAEGMPFVCAGGGCCCNPGPIEEVFDFLVVGDGEEVLPEILRLHGAWKQSGEQRQAFLLSLASVEGVYVPSHGAGAGVRRRFVPDLDMAWAPEAPVVPVVEAVHERAVCEIARGCGRGCRFCQAGVLYRPVRKRSPERIREILDAQLAHTGYDEVSLLSLSAGDYPQIEPLVADLMDALREIDVSLSLPSLRLDSISPEALARIAAYKKSSLTFAPEAGTQRLRDIIRKNITEEEILAGVERAIEIGWNRVKLYFMIGLPTETQEDLDGIVRLAEAIVKRARELQEKGRRGFGLTVSVSNFVPKPHTPFQWAHGDSEETLRDKVFYLKDRLRAVKGASFRFHDTRMSAVEMMLAKGDRRTFRAIRRAWELGCRFDSWREHFEFGKWERAFAEAGIPVGTDPYTDPGAPLPWDFVDVGSSPAQLRKEYERAFDEADR
jgi:putative nucleotidyltransferase with HDIG domain